MEQDAAQAVAPEGLGGEAVELLQRLIRYDTVNPPGNEEQAQLHLRKLLTDAGWDCELLAAVEGRPNLVARPRGEAHGPPPAMISPLHTGKADPPQWTHDPS